MILLLLECKSVFIHLMNLAIHSNAHCISYSALIVKRYFSSLQLFHWAMVTDDRPTFYSEYLHSACREKYINHLNGTFRKRKKKLKWSECWYMQWKIGYFVTNYPSHDIHWGFIASMGIQKQESAGLLPPLHQWNGKRKELKCRNCQVQRTNLSRNIRPWARKCLLWRNPHEDSWMLWWQGMSAFLLR